MAGTFWLCLDFLMFTLPALSVTHFIPLGQFTPVFVPVNGPVSTSSLLDSCVSLVSPDLS